MIFSRGVWQGYFNEHLAREIEDSLFVLVVPKDDGDSHMENEAGGDKKKEGKDMNIIIASISIGDCNDIYQFRDYGVDVY